MTVQNYIPNQSHFTIPIHFQLISCNNLSSNWFHVAICLCSWLIPSCHLPLAGLFLAIPHLERYISDDAEGCQSFRLSVQPSDGHMAFHSLQRTRCNSPHHTCSLPLCSNCYKGVLANKGNQKKISPGIYITGCGKDKEKNRHKQFICKGYADVVVGQYTWKITVKLFGLLCLLPASVPIVGSDRHWGKVALAWQEPKSDHI